MGVVMRFILNFFLFGFLFYLIYVFFPEAFSTLTSWAGFVYEFFRGLVQQITERINESRGGATGAAEPHKAALFMLRVWFGSL